MPVRVTYNSPVPEGKPFTVAQLRTINFGKLVERDPQEAAKLLEAGEKDGFFYLDLTTPASKGLWKDYTACLEVLKKWFDTPLEEKTQYAYGSDVQGYKPIGTQTGATEKSKDGFETLRIAQTGLAWQNQPLPAAVLDQSTLFNDFIDKTRYHVIQLLSSFSDAMGLEGDDRFERKHPDNRPSHTSMTFHRYNKLGARDVSNVGHNKHTDISSIAFLFAQQWGLQVPSTTSENSWDYVRTQPGFAICNVGDSLRFLSGFRLRSVLHRVVPTVEMEQTHRYSVAYFTRPVDGTTFKDSEGRIISIQDWFEKKFDIYRASHEEQRKNTMLTGGIEDAKARARIHLREEIQI
ncbi:Clavaminate synthase-like protein [Xylona heveae TC161]|uniref:Clavaminate synthase-like protein n=1 Tax=Xylona heveae (strain CBS 132557 / TC161) TaxID=1328760 RepID=A0A164Z863_XYLHT|nr:Clavaminate synthase-like protein [Xylona heveae TC161]KZF18806.1 Clavaminate synthase-like protein [Xylona heveae TC161]